MLAYYTCALVTAASAFTSFGFSAVAVRQSNESDVALALYATARSISLAGASVVPFFYHNKTLLIVVALAMITVQAVDAYIGRRLRDTVKTYGPLCTSLLNLLALGWLLVS